jgi:hypothetical protein
MASGKGRHFLFLATYGDTREPLPRGEVDMNVEQICRAAAVCTVAFQLNGCAERSEPADRDAEDQEVQDDTEVADDAQPERDAAPEDPDAEPLPDAPDTDLTPDVEDADFRPDAPDDIPDTTAPDWTDAVIIDTVEQPDIEDDDADESVDGSVSVDGGSDADATEAPDADSLDAATSPTLRDLAIQVFLPKCGGGSCHLDGANAGELSLDYDDGLVERLLGTSQTGLPYVVPGAPDESWLLLKVDGRYRDADVAERGSSMPLGGIPLTTGQLRLLRDWIEGLPPLEDATPP